jgi:hypothetical protein
MHTGLIMILKCTGNLEKIVGAGKRLLQEKTKEQERSGRPENC